MDGVSAAEASEFAMGALEALQRASPRSLAVTLRHFAAVAAAVRAGDRGPPVQHILASGCLAHISAAACSGQPLNLLKPYPLTRAPSGDSYRVVCL